VQFRAAKGPDFRAIQNLDIGPVDPPWLAEVAEMLRALREWRDDQHFAELDRQVDVLVNDKEVVAVAAHERIPSERSGVLLKHRYLMVAAVDRRWSRNGFARQLIESIFADQASSGVETFTWLVHPKNLPSLAFNRATFPEADETNPPDDQPYVAFTVSVSPHSLS
jgi:GNAT superfamily N-acetyltransferase